MEFIMNIGPCFSVAQECSYPDFCTQSDVPRKASNTQRLEIMFPP